ncbi:MAG: ParA family protein, partial [Actinobacteria bacterium]|nr:ParA family protein [Actinomycetota bacterium]
NNSGCIKDFKPVSSFNMEKIVFFNTKGGTGKTTICYNYGWYLSEKKNKKVLFMDFDPQINLVQAFGRKLDGSEANLDRLIIDSLKGKEINFKDYIIKISDNLDLLPSSNNISLIEEYLTDYIIDRTFTGQDIYKAYYRNIIIRDIFEKTVPGDYYDYIVIDSQPNFSLLSTTAIIYTRKVVIVLKPELFSLLDIEYLNKIIKSLEKKYKIEIMIAGIVVNAFEKRKKIPGQVINILEKKYGGKVKIFDQKIRYLTHYQKSISSNREPVFKSFPDSEASIDILNLFSQIEGAINNTNRS